MTTSQYQDDMPMFLDDVPPMSIKAHLETPWGGTITIVKTNPACLPWMVRYGAYVKRSIEDGRRQQEDS